MKKLVEIYLKKKKSTIRIIKDYVDNMNNSRLTLCYMLSDNENEAKICVCTDINEKCGDCHVFRTYQNLEEALSGWVDDLSSFAKLMHQTIYRLMITDLNTGIVAEAYHSLDYDDVYNYRNFLQIGNPDCLMDITTESR